MTCNSAGVKHLADKHLSRVKILRLLRDLGALTPEVANRRIDDIYTGGLAWIRVQDPERRRLRRQETHIKSGARLIRRTGAWRIRHGGRGEKTPGQDGMAA